MKNLATIINEPSKLSKIDMNVCSKKCCNSGQWDIPHMKKSNKDYVATNLMCNNGRGSGCVCMEKNDFEQISSRGGNIPKCT